MEHIWTILIIKKNTHTCERNRIEIDQRKIFKISLLIYNSFYLAKKKSQIRQQISYEYSNGKCWYLFSIRKSLGIHRTICQCYHRETFISLAMQSSRRLFIFNCVLKADKLQGVFERRNLVKFYSIKWTSFEIWYVYKYQITLVNVLQKNIWKEKRNKTIIF